MSGGGSEWIGSLSLGEDVRAAIARGEIRAVAACSVLHDVHGSHVVDRDSLDAWLGGRACPDPTGSRGSLDAVLGTPDAAARKAEREARARRSTRPARNARRDVGGVD